MGKNRLIELVLFKAYAELKAESARNYISFFWWVIEPIIHMGVFYVIFDLVFHRGGPDYVPFLLCGLVVWKWFVSTVNQGSASILTNTNLIRQIYIDKAIFPASVLIANTVRFFFVFSLLILFILAYGVRPSITWTGLPVVLLTQFLFTAAITGFACVIVPFIPDIKLLIENGLLLMFFVSGIFFDISTTSEKLQFFLRFNPMAVLIEEYRQMLLLGQWPSWQAVNLIAFFSIAGVIIAYRLITRYDHLYPKILV